MMNDRPTRWLRAAALTVCGALFLAASCEQRKSTPEPKDGASERSSGETSGDEAATVASGAGEIFEKKSPKSVGPEAPAIFMLSGLKGYTEPCGCTLDVMLGGIDRIAGYVEQARELYPAVHFVDGGDTFFETKTIAEHELPQERARVELITRALAEMKVEVTVPGEKDFALGVETYARLLADSGIEAVAVNLDVPGLELMGTKRVTTAFDVVYAGVVDPTHYAEIDGVTATDPVAALTRVADDLKNADVSVLLVHGDVVFAKKMLAVVPGVDFALVGHDPRETDQVDRVDGAHTLEPYDQGRYLGILKLFGAKGAAGTPFTNARSGSKAELEKIARQIEHVNGSIDRLPPATPGEESEMLLTLRRRLKNLQDRREEIKNASIELPDGKPAFVWRTVAMEPGFEPHEELAAARAAYNAKLRELNDVDRDVLPVPAGAAEFVGNKECATCHQEADAFWKKTAHAKALSTLQERDKAFDQKCIGCHVVGYEQPGGSVLGKLEYDAEVEIGGSTIELHKDLRNVGCESCHGPGSKHRGAPIGSDGTPQHIIVDPGVTECLECHVPEHSPRFRFDVYVDQITGEGHERD